jgi:hypothetical protein
MRRRISFVIRERRGGGARLKSMRSARTIVALARTVVDARTAGRGVETCPFAKANKIAPPRVMAIVMAQVKTLFTFGGNLDSCLTGKRANLTFFQGKRAIAVPPALC